MGRRIDPERETDLQECSDRLDAITTWDEILYNISATGALISLIVMLLGLGVAVITEPNNWTVALFGALIYGISLLCAVATATIKEISNKVRVNK
ncbi:MAG: hypothetical protein WC845_01200 [Candidatus Staskawiczbacteria bacterium]|jgi:hypothetical protein